MSKIAAFLKANWARLQQAALFLPGGNSMFNNPEFSQTSYRVLIVRLSPFRDVERSTPHLFLYQAVRRALPDAYVDMAFFPPEYDRERFITHQIPLLVGTLSWRSAEDFDVILISNAYTLELINLPYLFIHSGFPVMAGERPERYPPVILGGSNALASQAILKPDGNCMVDAIFFGEGERQVEDLIYHLYKNKAEPKKKRLQLAAKTVTGLWVANNDKEQSVWKACCDQPGADDMLTLYPLLNGEEADVARMQITYGCPAFCSFCFEGYDRKPYREVTLEDVWSTAVKLKKEVGPATLDLVSFNFNTYANIFPLLLRLSHLFYRVSYKSQRVDILSAMPRLLEAELVAGKRSYTVGIEGISWRMRTFLHKSLSDDEIDSLISRLLHRNVREMKLFYILTGYEKDADIAEFRQFLRTLKYQRTGKSRGVRIIFSFGLLIRMPFTPLRYDQLFLEEGDWKDITGQIKSACEINGFEFRLATSWPDYATSQVLALGGYWLWEPLLELAKQDYCYDKELPEDYWLGLKAWMHEKGYWTSDFLSEKPSSANFPLEFVKQRVSRQFLYQQYEMAKAGVDNGYCLGEIGQRYNQSSKVQCLGCNACTSMDERAAITGHKMVHPDANYIQELKQLIHSKRHIKPVYMHVRLPLETVGKTAVWLNAWVLRDLLRNMPDQVENILTVQERLFTTKNNIKRYTGMYGETVFALYAWDAEVLRKRLNSLNIKTDKMHFIQWVHEFIPGEFMRAEFSITLPTSHFPDAGQHLRKYLQNQYVPVNLRRTAEGYTLDLPQKAMQKRVLFSGDFTQNDSEFACRIVVSPKFNVLEYLQSFSEPYWSNEALVEVSNLAV